MTTLMHPTWKAKKIEPPAPAPLPEKPPAPAPLPEKPPAPSKQARAQSEFALLNKWRKSRPTCHGAQDLSACLKWANKITGFDISLEDFRSESRSSELVLTRELVAVRLRYAGGLGYEKIRDLANGMRGHSPWIHRVDRMVRTIVSSLGEREWQKITAAELEEIREGQKSSAMNGRRTE